MIELKNCSVGVKQQSLTHSKIYFYFQAEIRKYITDKIQEEVFKLKEKAERLHQEQV